MKCEEIQSHLSDYLDHAAEGGRAKTIEAHLTGCPVCSEEFSDLLRCRKLVAKLPIVEPPLGFTTRVMANVAEAAQQRGFWNRILLPLNLKIPLQASAVIIVAVLSFYVYQKEDNGPLETPVVEHSPAAAAPSPRAETARPEAAPIAPESSAVKAGSSGPTAHKSRRAKSEQFALASNSQPSLAGDVQPGDAGIRPKFAIPAQGVVAGAGMSGSIGIPHQPMFRLFPNERELPDLGEPVADYELFVRVTPRRQRDVRAANSDGNSEKKESSAEEPLHLRPSPVLDVVWYRIPQDQYEQFKSDLANQAKIESEVPIGIKDRQWSFRSDGPLFVKVTLLGAGE